MKTHIFGRLSGIQDVQALLWRKLFDNKLLIRVQQIFNSQFTFAVSDAEFNFAVSYAQLTFAVSHAQLTFAVNYAQFNFAVSFTV